ncbi:unnamed protein product [Meganyctiphanes norvegica]|uniref:XK-related protein n=1 Tax=Meganyctiphanes norvegica TaxID=48144 RepID=A0AAV2PVL1_MEGNR
MMTLLKVALSGMVPLTIYTIDLATDILTTREYCYADEEDYHFMIYCYLSIAILMGPSIVLNTILLYLFWLESWSKKCWIKTLLILAWLLQLLPAFSLVRHVVKVVSGSSNAAHIPGNAQMVRSTLTFLADIPQISLQTYIMAKYLTSFEYDLVTPMKIASIIISLFSIALNMGRFYCKVRQVYGTGGKLLVLVTIFLTTGCRLSVCALAAATFSPSFWFVPVGVSFLLVFVVTYAYIRLSRSRKLVYPARLLEDLFYAAVLQSVCSVAGIYSSIAFIASAVLLYTNQKDSTILTVLVLTIVCQVLATIVDALLHQRGIYKQVDNIIVQKVEHSTDYLDQIEERNDSTEVNADISFVHGEHNLAFVRDVECLENINDTSRNSISNEVATSTLESMSSLPMNVKCSEHREGSPRNSLPTEVATSPVESTNSLPMNGKCSEHIEASSRNSLPTEVATSPVESMNSLPMNVKCSEHIEASSRNSLPTEVATSPVESMNSLPKNVKCSEHIDAIPSIDVSHTQNTGVDDTSIRL